VNLADPGELRGFLRKYGLTPDKGLGQHFLCSRSVVDAIVRAIPAGTSILEIGPGPGVLTGPLSQRGPTFALELDPRMVEALSESAPDATVVQGDALKVDLEALLEGSPSPRAVVSNLPYYITGPLLGRIAEARASWALAVLMMQQEVATKILAQAGKRERGAISVRMQAQFTVSKVCNVPPSAFIPPPKVDSAVLQFMPKQGGSADLPEAFFQLVQAGFAQPRKTLANNLAARGQERDVVARAGLDPSVRPHQLDQSDWERIWVTCQV
jgi:16S rRNA (adenine1518-N6/adenine1519-N6)-dimethyltransferase